jgi:hypothetical protein
MERVKRLRGYLLALSPERAAEATDELEQWPDGKSIRKTTRSVGFKRNMSGKGRGIGRERREKREREGHTSPLPAANCPLLAD